MPKWKRTTMKFDAFDEQIDFDFVVQSIWIYARNAIGMMYVDCETREGKQIGLLMVMRNNMHKISQSLSKDVQRQYGSVASDVQNT